MTGWRRNPTQQEYQKEETGLDGKDRRQGPFFSSEDDRRGEMWGFVSWARKTRASLNTLGRDKGNLNSESPVILRLFIRPNHFSSIVTTAARGILMISGAWDSTRDRFWGTRERERGRPCSMMHYAHAWIGNSNYRVIITALSALRYEHGGPENASANQLW